MPDYMDDINAPIRPAEPPNPTGFVNNQQGGFTDASQSAYGSTQTNSYGSQSGYDNNAYGSQSGYSSTQTNSYGSQSGYDNNAYGSQSGYSSTQTNAYGSQSAYNSTSSSSYDSSNNYAGSVYDQNYGDPYANSANTAMRAATMDSSDFLKGILGAVVGSLPGVLLWLVLASVVLSSLSVGFIVSIISFICPMMIGVGALLGYFYVTKDKLGASDKSILICAIVAMVMIFITLKMVYCIQISDIYSNLESLMQKYAGFTGYSKEEIKEMFKNVDSKELTKSITGYEKIDFGTCFVHFSSILKKLSMKGDFIYAFFKSCLWAAAGSTALIKKGKLF